MLQIVKYKNSLLLQKEMKDSSFFKRLNCFLNDFNKSNSNFIDIFPSIKKYDLEILNKPRIYKKKLRLTGLGYKGLINNDILSFKLNLSHELQIIIPSYIKMSLRKKHNIYFESYDPVLLGNFIEYIYLFRPKNPYTGRGFSLVSKRVVKKAVKKK